MERRRSDTAVHQCDLLRLRVQSYGEESLADFGSSYSGGENLTAFELLLKEFRIIAKGSVLDKEDVQEKLQQLSLMTTTIRFRISRITANAFQNELEPTRDSRTGLRDICILNCMLQRLVDELTSGIWDSQSLRNMCSIGFRHSLHICILIYHLQLECLTVLTTIFTNMDMESLYKLNEATEVEKMLISSENLVYPVSAGIIMSLACFYIQLRSIGGTMDMCNCTNVLWKRLITLNSADCVIKMFTDLTTLLKAQATFTLPIIQTQLTNFKNCNVTDWAYFVLSTFIAHLLYDARNETLNGLSFAELYQHCRSCIASTHGVQSTPTRNLRSFALYKVFSVLKPIYVSQTLSSGEHIVRVFYEDFHRDLRMDGNAKLPPHLKDYSAFVRKLADIHEPVTLEPDGSGTPSSQIFVKLTLMLFRDTFIRDDREKDFFGLANPRRLLKMQGTEIDKLFSFYLAYSTLSPERVSNFIVSLSGILNESATDVYCIRVYVNTLIFIYAQIASTEEGERFLKRILEFELIIFAIRNQLNIGSEFEQLIAKNLHSDDYAAIYTDLSELSELPPLPGFLTTNARKSNSEVAINIRLKSKLSAVELDQMLEDIAATPKLQKRDSPGKKVVNTKLIAKVITCRATQNVPFKDNHFQWFFFLEMIGFIDEDLQKAVTGRFEEVFNDIDDMGYEPTTSATLNWAIGSLNVFRNIGCITQADSCLNKWLPAARAKEIEDYLIGSQSTVTAVNVLRSFLLIFEKCGQYFCSNFAELADKGKSFGNSYLCVSATTTTTAIRLIMTSVSSPTAAMRTAIRDAVFAIFRLPLHSKFPLRLLEGLCCQVEPLFETEEMFGLLTALPLSFQRQLEQKSICKDAWEKMKTASVDTAPEEGIKDSEPGVNMTSQMW